jgi:hypothetical protein
MYTLYCSPGSVAMAPRGVFEKCGADDTLVPVDLAASKREDAAHRTLHPQDRRRRPATARVLQQTQPA